MTKFKVTKKKFNIDIRKSKLPRKKLKIVIKKNQDCVEKLTKV